MFQLIRGDRGFSLVELMVVVLIIGILVAIAIPILNNATNAAKKNTCLANVRTIDSAVSQFAAQKDTTPEQAVKDGLLQPDSAQTGGALVGSFLKDAAVCPFNVPYVLNSTGDTITHQHK